MDKSQSIGRISVWFIPVVTRNTSVKRQDVCSALPFSTEILSLLYLTRTSSQTVQILLEYFLTGYLP